MNKGITYCLIGIAILLSACTSNRKYAENALFPSGDYMLVSHEKVKLSSLFSQHRLIPLETNDSSLIGGRGNKIIKRDSCFYVESENAILCFNNQGKFLRRIAHQGSGPGEYAEIADFDVVPSPEGGQELWIASVSGLQVYNVISGDFLRKINVNNTIHQFRYVNENTLLTITSDDYIFHVCDLSGHIRKDFYEKDLANSTHKFNQFFSYQGKIAYQIGDTQTAIVYDPETDACDLQPILQPQENMLTPDISREYYDKYGYLEQYEQLGNTYTQLSTIRAIGHNAIFTWIAPERKYLLTTFNSSGYRTVPFSAIENDIIPTSSNLFLATIIACESDPASTWLFQIPAELIQQEGVSKEDNMWLLEIKL